LMKEEGGFTLVELLVTIAILAVLFGVVTLTLTGVGSDAQTTVCDAEKGVVQSAMDIYLAEDASNTISEQQSPAIQITESDTGFEQYLRGTTMGSYTWGAGGDNLNQEQCPVP
ncbi:MAG: type II secretion system protein, partial [Chloroflexota bacterium]